MSGEKYYQLQETQRQLLRQDKFSSRAGEFESCIVGKPENRSSLDGHKYDQVSITYR